MDTAAPAATTRTQHSDNEQGTSKASKTRDRSRTSKDARTVKVFAGSHTYGSRRGAASVASSTTMKAKCQKLDECVPTASNASTSQEDQQACACRLKQECRRRRATRMGQGHLASLTHSKRGATTERHARNSIHRKTFRKLDHVSVQSGSSTQSLRLQWRWCSRASFSRVGSPRHVCGQHERQTTEAEQRQSTRV